MSRYAKADSSLNSRVWLSRGLTLSVVPTHSICYHRTHALSLERYTFFDCIGEERVAVCPLLCSFCHGNCLSGLSFVWSNNPLYARWFGEDISQALRRSHFGSDPIPIPMYQEDREKLSQSHLCWLLTLDSRPRGLP